jgi:hypothetical protein
MSSEELIRQILECVSLSRAVENQPSARNTQGLTSAINIAAKRLEIYVDSQISQAVKLALEEERGLIIQTVVRAVNQALAEEVRRVEVTRPSAKSFNEVTE